MDVASLQIALVLALVVVVFFGFVREIMAPEITAFGSVAVLLAAGILTTHDVLSVFSNSAPITVAAMFVLSAALERTGVIDLVGRQMLRAANWSARSAIAAMLAGAMGLSAFINNTPVVVILTPIVIRVGEALRQPASKLLIPLSYAAIFGGTTTLIGTSTNLLVDGVAQQHGMRAFGMFEITLAGMAMGTAGIAYLILFGRWLLPERQTLASMLPDSSERHFLGEVLVPLDSPLVGKTLAEAGFTEQQGFRVVDLLRSDTSHQPALKEIVLQGGDRLFVRSRVGDMLALREAGDVAVGRRGSHPLEPIASRETVVMEGIVGPQSRLIGRRVGKLYLRRLYRATVLAMHRQGVELLGNFDDVRLRMGDTILLEGPPESMRRLFEDQELINLVQPQERPMRRSKAPVAIAAVATVMALAAFEVLPIAGLAIMAATAVIAFGCLEADEAYASIRWNILMLIFAMLALGLAMEKTGAARLIVEQFAAVVGGLGPIAVLAALYFMTSLLTEIMSNNAAAILLTPLAIGLAATLGVDPRPFVVAVMFAASASFATPIGYQTNTFVYNAGGYRFADFIRVGLPLNLLLWLIAVVVIPMQWPLG